MSDSANGSKPWDIQTARSLYNIDRWGAKYFDINAGGHVVAMPLQEAGAAVDLTDVLPPDELAEALNAVINAQTDADAQFFRAEAECKQLLVSAERGVEIARSRAQAIATEIVTIGSFLEELARQGTLDAYVARRSAEVLSESGTLFLKEGS